MQRLVDGPDKQWLTEEEIADWLGVGSTVFRQMVRNREFPKPVQVRGRIRRWPWLDAVAYLHWMERMGGLPRENKPGPAPGAEK